MGVIRVLPGEPEPVASADPQAVLLEDGAGLLVAGLATAEPAGIHVLLSGVQGDLELLTEEGQRHVRELACEVPHLGWR